MTDVVVALATTIRWLATGVTRNSLLGDRKNG
jgi:hypothetical protein